jgi:hypothetical protein
MRIFLKGFNTETHLRFATLELSYMQERTYRDMISVYPNPTRGLLTIDFDNRAPRSLMMADQQGKVLLNQHINPGSGPLVTIDLSTLADGIYMLKLVTDEETIVKKVVLNRQ